MVVKYGRYGKFLACSGYPECKNIKSYAEKIEVPCPVCGSEVLVRKTKRGKNYYICINNNKESENPCNYISWNKPKEGEKWSPEMNEKATKSVGKKSKRTSKRKGKEKTKSKSSTKKVNKK